jgi:hypothetical protein
VELQGRAAAAKDTARWYLPCRSELVVTAIS